MRAVAAFPHERVMRLVDHPDRLARAVERLAPPARIESVVSLAEGA